MPDNLTPEETKDNEHSKGSLDEDTEGTGVDEPNLDEASWDDEVEPEDREDFTAAKIKFEELTDEDREIYLEMVSLREEFGEGSAEKEGMEDIKKLIRRCEDIKSELMEGTRPKFLDLMIKKLKEL